MGVQPFGQLLNGLRQARLFDAVPKLLGVNVLIGLGDVFRHGYVQNGKFLEYGAEQPIVFPAVKVPYVHAVQQHPPLGGVEQTAQQLYKGGLARAVQSHDGQLFPGAHRQVKIVDGILLRPGVAEGHMLQLQLAGIRLGNGHAALKPEGFRVVQKFPHLRNVKAFLVQLLRRLQNAHDPGGEGGHRGKIQDKFRHAQRIPERHVEQVSIGDAVPRHGKQRFGNIRQQPNLLTAQQKIQIHVLDAIHQLVQPALQAEDPDILCQLHGLRLIANVPRLRVISFFLVPVSEFPVVGMAGQQEAGHAGDNDHPHQHPVQAGQDGEVHQKAAHILHQLCQGLPNQFRRLIVALGRLMRLFPKLDKLCLQRIGEGGHVALSADHAHNIGAHVHPWEQGDLLKIRLETHGQEQCQGKQPDGAQQLAHGGMALHAA